MIIAKYEIKIARDTLLSAKTQDKRHFQWEVLVMITSIYIVCFYFFPNVSYLLKPKCRLHSAIK